jgi:hypothetical protein
MKRNVISEATFAFARELIADCLFMHVPSGICDPPPDNDLPTRLIRIDLERDAFRLKLEERLDAQQLRWVCLSYCWGGDQPIKLTRDTREDFLECISFVTLPRTLQDAITVTSGIGMSFIWIDCLCIIQDDEEDKAREIDRMPIIYNGACVTISASSAASCFDGFLHRRSLPLENTPFALRYQSSDGEEGRIIFADNFSPAKYPDPANIRAWTFQERVLSPRLLDFSTTQLRWRCLGCKERDSGFNLSREVFPVSEYKYIITRPNDLRHRDQNPVEMWEKAVRDYTLRKLSFPGDKLVAISAIAQATPSRKMGRYIAGLWEEDLHTELLWSCSTPGARPAEYRGPTWSWVSVEGVVDLHGDGFRVMSETKDESNSNQDSEIEGENGSGQDGEIEDDEIEDGEVEDGEIEDGEIEGGSRSNQDREAEDENGSGQDSESEEDHENSSSTMADPDWRQIVDVVECEAIPLYSSAPYGAVKSAYLILKGRMEFVTWFYLIDRIRFDGATELCGDNGFLYHDALLQHGSSNPDSSMEVWCMAFSISLGTDFSGLLLEEDKSMQCFRRIGCFKYLVLPQYPQECNRELFTINQLQTIKII